MRLPLLALIALAASCSKAPERKAGDAMTAREVSAEASKLKLEPGQWETTMAITDMAVSGVPADATKAATGTPTTTTNCVTPEQAAKPGADFLSGTRDGNCAYQRFSMAGDRIDAAMTCSPRGVPGATKIAIDLKGGYSPTTFAMGMNMNTDLPGKMAMTMTATVKGRRVGACTGQEGTAT